MNEYSTLGDLLGELDLRDCVISQKEIADRTDGINVNTALAELDSITLADIIAALMNTAVAL